MNEIQRYEVLLYARGSELGKVDEAREVEFTQSGKQVESLAPTLAALIEHATENSVWRSTCVRTVLGSVAKPSMSRRMVLEESWPCMEASLDKAPRSNGWNPRTYV